MWAVGEASEKGVFLKVAFDVSSEFIGHFKVHIYAL